MVPGCMETDCYSLSLGSGGAVSLCRECSAKLYGAFCMDKSRKKKKGEGND